jgi:prepilin-type N-terminal cleavage/methylation domain-containing protein
MMVRNPRGMTLVEIAVAMSILAVLAAGLLMLLAVSVRETRLSNERLRAQEAARMIFEDMIGRTPSAAYAAYNTATADDPTDPPENPITNAPWGPAFDVPGLRAPADAPFGLPGLVLFPEAGGTLREDVVDPVLGMPLDLDGDGTIGVPNLANLRILPFRIRVVWQVTPTRTATYEIQGVLGRR